MQIAIQEARRGCARGEGGPFGACIVRRSRLLARSHNQVLKTQDPTRHAEVCAIGLASKRLGSCHLTDCEIYSTTEPCPMCFAAIHWARIPRIYYGTSIGDVQRLGFNELAVSNRTLKRLGRSPIRLFPGFCRRDCLKLLKSWSKLPHRRTY